MSDTNSSTLIERMAPTLRELQVCAVIAGVVSALALVSLGRVGPASDMRVVTSTQPQELSAAPAGQLDLNGASAAELELLPGIGLRRAQAIIQERTRRGAFTSVWELTEIPGLSKALVQRLAPMLRVRSSRD